MFLRVNTNYIHLTISYTWYRLGIMHLFILIFKVEYFLLSPLRKIARSLVINIFTEKMYII